MKPHMWIYPAFFALVAAAIWGVNLYDGIVKGWPFLVVLSVAMIVAMICLAVWCVYRVIED